ncbi:MAG TPA: prolyl oligopeptidase family serine peptidase [Gemmatimonadota bacterium]|nr:prolyl oligopeptidase family serine peptidase [Gemmatimonadota bacterium]
MRRAGCLIALAALGVLGLAVRGYLARDYRPTFSRIAGELVMVRDETQVGATESGDLVMDYTLVSDTGFTVRVRVRTPSDLATGERRPAVLLVNGLRTGIRAAEVPTSTGGAVMASVAFPYDGPTRDLSTWQWIRHFGEIRRGLIDTPSALLLAAQYLYSRPDVDPDRVTIIGVSLGVPFATAAAATDHRLAGAALIHGGGDLRRLLLAAYGDDRPGYVAEPAAAILAGVLAPLEPVKYVDDIAPRPVLVISATGDERIPRESVLALYEAARRPKKMVWVESTHVAASEREIIDDLMGHVLEWMGANGLR